MKSYATFFLLLFFGVLLLSGTVRGAYQLEYRIEVHADGSAVWVMEHRFVKGEDEALFTQLSNPTYFRDTFIKNVKSLVSAAAEKTQRTNMTVKNFVMAVSVLSSYSVVKYQFYWTEFARIENSRVKIGDVFEVEGLFLYGEDTVNIVYPIEYVVESVSPRPHAESNQTLTWYGIEDFGAGEPKIVLGEKVAFGFMDVIKQNALIIGGLITLAGGVSISFYYFKFRKKERKEILGIEAPAPPSIPGIKDDKERVVDLLRVACGSLYQSTIADQCGFSRSKTSKLLATMESEGRLRREEKGREKVVTLVEEDKKSEDTRNERRA